MNIYEAVKNRILTLLEEKNLSIHKLALESGVPPSTIKNILYKNKNRKNIIKLLRNF